MLDSLKVFFNKITSEVSFFTGEPNLHFFSSEIAQHDCSARFLSRKSPNTINNSGFSRGKGPRQGLIRVPQQPVAPLDKLFVL
jgi:hypothetical protein